jgi:hypothetical protein
MAIELELDESDALLRARSAQAIGIPIEAIHRHRIARRSLDTSCASSITSISSSTRISRRPPSRQR